MSEPSSRSMALAYLSSISGFKNPEDHTTEWFERAMTAARADTYTREEMREATAQNYQAGVLAERERCARIAELMVDDDIAAAIRAGESEERTSDE